MMSALSLGIRAQNEQVNIVLVERDVTKGTVDVTGHPLDRNGWLVLIVQAVDVTCHVCLPVDIVGS